MTKSDVTVRTGKAPMIVQSSPTQTWFDTKFDCLTYKDEVKTYENVKVPGDENTSEIPLYPCSHLAATGKECTSDTCYLITNESGGTKEWKGVWNGFGPWELADGRLLYCVKGRTG